MKSTTAPPIPRPAFPNEKRYHQPLPAQPLTPWQASPNPGRSRRQRRSSPGGRRRRPLRVFAAGTRPEPVHVAPLPVPTSFPRRDSRLRVETLPLLVLLNRFASFGAQERTCGGMHGKGRKLQPIAGSWTGIGSGGVPRGPDRCRICKSAVHDGEIGSRFVHDGICVTKAPKI